MHDPRQLPGAANALDVPLPADQDTPFALLHQLHRIYRGRYAAAISLALLGAIAGGLAGFLTQKPWFQSVGLIRIQPVVEKVLYDTEQNQMPPMFTSYVRTQANLLQEPRVVTRAMGSDRWKSLGRGLTPEAREEFLDSLKVGTERDDPEWIRVRFNDRDPKAAKIAVEEIIRAYEEIWGESELFSSPEMIRTLEDKARKIRADIDARLELVRSIGREFGTVDLAELHTARFKELMDLEQTSRQVGRTLEEAEAAANAASEAPADEQAPSDLTEERIAQVAAADPRMKQLLSMRLSAHARVERLKSAGIGEKHREMKSARADVAAMEFQVATYAREWWAQHASDAVGAMPGGPLPAVAVEQLRARQKAVQSSLDAVRTATLDLNEKRLRIDGLQEQNKRDQEQLDAVEHRLDIIRTESKASDISGVSGRINIVSYGEEPFSPSSDPRKKWAAVGVVAGGGIPLGVIALLGLFDRRFRYADETGDGQRHIPLLGILPSLPKDLHDPEQASVAAHCVHQIRALLQIGGAASGRRVFAVTSPTPGDGKTSLTLSLGLSFAGSGARTLLIDFDMIGGGLTSMLRIASESGIADALQHAQLNGHVVPTDFPRLSILPLGRADDNETSRLSPGAVRTLIDQARQQYDIVLIDTGPILASLEASLASAVADGVVLALGRGQQRRLAERAIDHLASVGARFLGVVFNRAEAGDFRRSIGSASVRSVPPEGAIVRVTRADADASAELAPMARTVAPGRHD